MGSVAGDEDPTARAAVPLGEAGMQFVGGEPRGVRELKLGPERLTGHVFKLRQLRGLRLSALPLPIGAAPDRVYPSGAHEAVPAFLDQREHEQDPAASLQHEVDPPFQTPHVRPFAETTPTVGQNELIFVPPPLEGDPQAVPH